MNQKNPYLVSINIKLGIIIDTPYCLWLSVIAHYSDMTRPFSASLGDNYLKQFDMVYRWHSDIIKIIDSL